MASCSSFSERAPAKKRKGSAPQHGNSATMPLTTPWQTHRMRERRRYNLRSLPLRTTRPFYCVRFILLNPTRVVHHSLTFNSKTDSRPRSPLTPQCQELSAGVPPTHPPAHDRRGHRTRDHTIGNASPYFIQVHQKQGSLAALLTEWRKAPYSTKRTRPTRRGSPHEHSAAIAYARQQITPPLWAYQQEALYLRLLARPSIL